MNVVYMLDDKLHIVGFPNDDLSNAAQSVPLGVPYKIVDRSEFPEDDSQRNNWFVEIDTPDGYGEGML